MVQHGAAAPLIVESGSSPTLRKVAKAFVGDIQHLTGVSPRMVTGWPTSQAHVAVLAGVVGQSPLLDGLERAGKLDLGPVRGKWESAVTTVVEHPAPGLERVLVIAGSDRRGAAYALFTLSRQMGVSPWNWWADVPVPHRASLFVPATRVVQEEPSVRYRGIFLNDEDWGLRPWAAKKMDPALGNIGPNTYNRIFELLLRLRANSLWPAMHPGTLAFNAVPENARLADEWGIVMGSSHSEALLRNNVGEWSEKTDGPWNYQTNREAIDRYWDRRVAENGQYENFYTVGMRGVHDSGLEATGTVEEKARLVEDVMRAQRKVLAAHVQPEVDRIPQVIWLYKESLELYRAGMQVPDDVTLGWTDDNYGYIRQLPTVAEQRRTGGSGIYYHVSYWGFPHDYLWLCTTPPALLQEELTKAYDHDVRRYWVLNVGDLKPAELDTDYFLQLAWDEPGMARMGQRAFLQRWFAEQFPALPSARVADLMGRYYALNFVRKPEFMGFNGYNDGIRRTLFNPLALGDQNAGREAAWDALAKEAISLGRMLPAKSQAAWFELVGYSVEAAAEQNRKLLRTDRSFLDVYQGQSATADGAAAHQAYRHIGELTAQYNQMLDGKWDGMMSDDPRGRQVFRDPVTAADAAPSEQTSPPGWAAAPPDAASRTAMSGFLEQDRTVSIEAAHFRRTSDSGRSTSAPGASVTDGWHLLPGVGVSGPALAYGRPGLLANQPEGAGLLPDAPWVEYNFTTGRAGDARLSIALLPTFPVDREHHLRFAVAVDQGKPHLLDPSGSGEWHEGSAPAWEHNVLQNFEEQNLGLPALPAGPHTLRLFYVDPGVVFEHLTLSFPGAPPAYPVPPETGSGGAADNKKGR